jgi:hypothetical protein
MLNVVILSAVILSVVILSVVMLSAVMLSVVTLIVLAPFFTSRGHGYKLFMGLHEYCLYACHHKDTTTILIMTILITIKTRDNA